MSGSILKEVTFTPQSFDNKFIFADKKRYRKLFAILENLITSGIIVATTSSWRKDVENLIYAYDDDDKYDLEFLLKELDKNNRIVSYPDETKYLNEIEYIKHIEDLNLKRAFDFISASINNSVVKTIENIDSSLYTNEGAVIDKQTVEFMEKMLAPVLAYAEIVKVIDPYFNFMPLSGDNTRYTKSMEIICKNLANHHGIKESAEIEIHTSVKAISKKEGHGKPILKWEYTESWKNIIKDYEVRYGHKIIVYIWEEVKQEDEWHDRYIDTTQCCIFMGKGLDRNDWTDSTWSLVKPDKAANIINKFEINNNRRTYLLAAIVDSKNGTQKQKENLCKLKSVEIYKTDEEKNIEKLQHIQRAQDEEELRLKKIASAKNFRRR